MSDSRKSKLESLLSLFTEVNSGEAKRALLMTLNIFLILTAYLLAKVVREPLILSGGGAEMKSYASAITVVLLLGVLKLYASMVAGLSRRMLINYVTLFFIACLAFFYVWLTWVGNLNGMVFFLWVGIFSLVIIAQFWSYANDTYTPEQGKRLFVLLAFGASAGGVFGPVLARVMLDYAGVNNLLLVSAGVLSLSLLLTNYIEISLAPETSLPEDTGPGSDGKAMSGEGALKVVFRNKYLLLIGLLILLSNWVNTTGEYILSHAVGEAAVDAVTSGSAESEGLFIGKFYADFFTVVGFVGLVLQLAVVSRFIKYLGIRTAVMTLPIIATGSYLLIGIYPILSIVSWSKTAENSVDYSLNNTVRHILFLPTTREEKYKAKVAIDSFFHRAGDVMSAAVVFIGAGWLAVDISYFAFFCLVGSIAGVILAYRIGAEHRRIMNRTDDATVADGRNQSSEPMIDTE